ncbi:hypothetical protein [Sporomusa acidovorans]|uniref:Uncharacterized protein n=1 Tax=Sporomusa acidovorans (strain ATCC 49682 / DSM 3132 / Mol) TaxID=1123286 RepID=A0ABZ3J1T3_SPOA4|nr:hypothetical protein [Sporomusa acidovorans]OZC23226.1 hypothetical protein SPACI_08760 [Sporomusa acidovorans DSM 3132]SDE98093.1 hypothetical protein SAMN04488499_102862 [Sporomusa acidovorans]
MPGYKKEIHEICVDKTSCQHEINSKRSEDNGSYWSIPTEKLTKDAIKKTYMQDHKNK